MSSHNAFTTPARIAGALGIALLGLAANARAQAQPALFGNRLELRPYVGAYLPTGDQRDLLEDAVLVGGQAAWRFGQQFALTALFGWSPSKDRITPGNQTVDVFQYDVGGEARWGNPDASSWSLTPFAGLGVGGRTYNYRDLDASAKTNVAGYGALGVELGIARLGVRLEARDYVSRFEPLTGGGSAKTRNDVTLATGLTVRF